MKTPWLLLATTYSQDEAVALTGARGWTGPVSTVELIKQAISSEARSTPARASDEILALSV